MPAISPPGPATLHAADPGGRAAVPHPPRTGGSATPTAMGRLAAGIRLTAGVQTWLAIAVIIIVALLVVPLPLAVTHQGGAVLLLTAALVARHALRR